MREHLEGKEVERLKIKKQIVCFSATVGPQQMDRNPFEDKYRVCVITMSLKMGLAFIHLLGSLVSQKHKTKAKGGY